MTVQARINQIGEWIFRLTLLNLLWLAFTVLGAGVLGVFPATSAVFAVIRQYRLGHKEVYLYQCFKDYFKQDFVQANVLGYLFVGMIIVAWIDYRYLLSLQNYWLVSISMLLLIATLVIILGAMMVFAFFVHYDLPLRKTLTNPFRFMINHLRRTFVMIILLTAWFYFVGQLPGVIPFLSVSVPIFIIHRMVEPVLIPNEIKGRKKQTSYIMNQEDMLYY